MKKDRINKFPIGYMRGLIANGAVRCVLDGPTLLDTRALEEAGFIKIEPTTGCDELFVRSNQSFAFRHVPFRY
jgi:hypothetical protein